MASHKIGSPSGEIEVQARHHGFTKLEVQARRDDVTGEARSLHAEEEASREVRSLAYTRSPLADKHTHGVRMKAESAYTRRLDLQITYATIKNYG